MTDVRQQLTEALDEIEREARAALDPADRWWWNVPESPAERHISRWRPEFVLRLVKRDRELVERHRPEPSGSGSPGPWCAGCDSNYEHVAECPELLAAAAFWVGTPEVDHG